MYFHDYDSNYDLAIPIVNLAISLERGKPSINLPALVDSGADATAIPVRYLKQLGALPSERRWLRSATGERHSVQLFEVYIQIGSYGRYLLIVGDTFSDEAALGRDILNYYIVKLDGPAMVIELSE